MSANKYEWLSWDWKASMPIDELNAALNEVFDGEHVPVVMEIPNTGSDQFVAVVSSTSITAEFAQQLYDNCEHD